MYPRTELTELAACKARVRQRIAMQRWQLALDAHRAIRPLELLDKAYEKWRQISPWAKLAAVPVGFLLKQALLKKTPVPKMHLMKSLVRWVPALAGVLWRGGSAQRTRGFLRR